ncbi:glycoside hydrolase family 16 protein [Methylobacterium sp. WL7]|nr:glycoside hydrolase family 16 protein [Methylobacterium sp. WL7]
MKLVFEDDFSGNTLDQLKWFIGPKPDGGQYGGAHFVTKDEPQFSRIYTVANGVLSIRAYYDGAYKDPEGWGRQWYSGQISSCFPDDRVTGAVRKGYFVMRAKLPAVRGAWPAFWLGNVAGNRNPNGGLEVDILEGYGRFPLGYVGTIHDWPGQSGKDHLFQQKHFDNMLGGANTQTDFHTYGLRITDTESIWYFDEKELVRFPLYRANDTNLGAFFAMIDLSVGGGWPVDQPKSGYMEMLVDYVRIYSAD